MVQKPFKAGLFHAGLEEEQNLSRFHLCENDQKTRDYIKVFVVETKGVHPKNEGTAYEQNVFDFCNKLCRKENMYTYTCLCLKELRKGISRALS